MTYTVVFEQGPTSWGAHVTNLPGCIAAGDSLTETAALIAEAIQAHTELLESQ